MENDTEAKHLALDFITRCRGEGRTIQTIANTAGWILQIIAHADAQRRSHNAAAPDLRTGASRSPDRLPEHIGLTPRLVRLKRSTALRAAQARRVEQA